MLVGLLFAFGIGYSAAWLTSGDGFEHDFPSARGLSWGGGLAAIYLVNALAAWG